jgi:hypothetical protein
MPHAGHFICGDRCAFRLNTYVPTGYIVSTVGELRIRPGDDEPWQPLGADKDSLYETMVFKARPSERACCPWRMGDAHELDGERYATADEAYRGHMRYIEKYAGEAGQP